MDHLSDAQSGDIYADETGKLWRVVGIDREPTYHLEEIEPRPGELRRRLSGHTSDTIWAGFIRIFRPKEQR